MGGIAGTYQQMDGERATRLMSGRLLHRGPDEEGSYAFVTDSVATHMAQRRLSIVGQAGAKQPFVKQRLALAYDGELYNHRELRAELVAHGASFQTRSDTEVVLEAWRHWGQGCLRKFRGMFAFAIFDEQTSSLFLARDHFGIKPLHYMCRQGGVVFASELKALVEAFGPELDIEPSALIASILFYCVPDSRCALSGVEKLQPGTCAEFRPDGTRGYKRYFDIAEVAAAAAAGPPTDVREVIEASVLTHLVPDVPMAISLSGAPGSEMVAVLAHRADPSIEAYAVAFRADVQYSEATKSNNVHARKLARRYGITLREVEVPDAVELVARLIDILDEPIADPAALSTLLISEAARSSGVRVLLSGSGANELFGGHQQHVACVMAERYRQLPGPARLLAGNIVSRLPVYAGGRSLRYARCAKRFLKFAELPEEAAFRRSYSLYDPAELTALLSPELAPDVVDLIGEHFEIYSDNLLADHSNRMRLADARFFLPGLTLASADRAAMAASVEVRSPFVDPCVFRAAFSIAGHRKISGRTGRANLKDMTRGWLPGDFYAKRPEASFSAALRTWVAKDLREVINDVLLNGDLVSTGFIRPEALDTMIAQNRSGRLDRSKQIWQLLALEFWYKRASRAGVRL